MAITFVSSNVTGSITDNEHRFAACGAWLQVSSERPFGLLGMECVQRLLITWLFAHVPFLQQQFEIMVHTGNDKLCLRLSLHMRQEAHQTRASRFL